MLKSRFITAAAISCAMGVVIVGSANVAFADTSPNYFYLNVNWLNSPAHGKCPKPEGNVIDTQGAGGVSSIQYLLVYGTQRGGTWTTVSMPTNVCLQGAPGTGQTQNFVAPGGTYVGAGSAATNCPSGMPSGVNCANYVQIPFDTDSSKLGPLLMVNVNGTTYYQCVKAFYGNMIVGCDASVGCGETTFSEGNPPDTLDCSKVTVY